MNHPSEQQEISSFEAMELDHRLLKTIAHMNFSEPTKIQQLAIPTILHGKDLLASSKTGSGKTLAFLIPALQRCLTQKSFNKKDPRILILAPTRELAQQVFSESRLFTANTGLKTQCVVGGENFNDQVKALRKNPQVIIATPGRLADHLAHRSLFLEGLEMLIMDEADRMLDLGFSEPLLKIHQAANHRRRQTCLFSATLDHGEVLDLAQALLNAPRRIRIGIDTEQHQDISQAFHFADHYDHKLELLSALLKQPEVTQTMVFTATREHTHKISAFLVEQGYTALALSGELNQSNRQQVMESFSKQEYQVLVSTDVASRGLDIASISHVINFDLPRHEEEYIHRIGRTGRAGQQGTAYSLVSKKDWDALQRIKALLAQEISCSAMPGHEAKFKGIKQKPKAAPKATPTKKAKAAPKKAAPKKKQPRNKDFYLHEDAGSTPIKKKPKT